LKSHNNISRAIAILTGVVIGIIIIAFPLGYFFLSYNNAVGNLEAEAEINARLITKIISTDPEMWEFEQMRLQEYLAHRPGSGFAEKRRIISKSGKLVAEHADKLDTPVIMRVANLYDAGTIVGQIEIYRSLNPVLVNTGLIALLTLPAGLGVFLILWFFPIRVIYRGEENLHESEERYRELSREFQSVLDCIRDPLFRLDPDLKILWANEGASSSLGMKTDLIQGNYCHALLHNHSTPCEDCAALRSFETKNAEAVQVAGPDGKLYDERAFPLMDEKGEIMSVVMVSFDITEKISLQAELMRAGHLASLGELAAGVAHEINNPINGVINYAQMLTDKMEPGSREEELSRRIIKEGSRIADIVRGLLSFARERKDDKIPVRIADILNETFSLTMTQLQKDHIILKTDIPENIPEITANPQQIQQVFLNIINNARYALNSKYPGPDENKRMEILCDAVNIHEARLVRIFFLDHGSGIPSDILDKVVNPFFTTKPPGSGTGLGLSISYGFIKDHGGSLQIESKEGEYAKIIIELPAMKPAFTQGTTGKVS